MAKSMILIVALLFVAVSMAQESKEESPKPITAAEAAPSKETLKGSEAVYLAHPYGAYPYAAYPYAAYPYGAFPYAAYPYGYPYPIFRR